MALYPLLDCGVFPFVETRCDRGVHGVEVTAVCEGVGQVRLGFGSLVRGGVHLGLFPGVPAFKFVAFADGLFELFGFLLPCFGLGDARVGVGTFLFDRRRGISLRLLGGIRRAGIGRFRFRLRCGELGCYLPQRLLRLGYGLLGGVQRVLPVALSIQCGEVGFDARDARFSLLDVESFAVFDV